MSKERQIAELFRKDISHLYDARDIEAWAITCKDVYRALRDRLIWSRKMIDVLSELKTATKYLGYSLDRQHRASSSEGTAACGASRSKMHVVGGQPTFFEQRDHPQLRRTWSLAICVRVISL
jgi:hypothetical protein